jgi:hypothetical protein
MTGRTRLRLLSRRQKYEKLHYLAYVGATFSSPTSIQIVPVVRFTDSKA